MGEEQGNMRLLRSGGLLAGAVLLVGCLVGHPVRAQNAICPMTIAGGQTGIFFDQHNSCTNGDKTGNVGAFSNTALASEALGELSQSSTQDSTRAAMGSIAERRATEQQSCPAGFTPVGGTCEPAVPSVTPDQTPAGMSMPSPLLTFVQQNSPSAVDPARRMAVWTQAYGNYERLSGSASGPANGGFTSLALSARSTTWNSGVLGGVDLTFRNVASGGDGLITGVLVGYEYSHMSIKTSSIASDSSIPNGSSTMTAQLSGPTGGVYASYFNRGFSTDLAFKVEFLDLSTSFNDTLGFDYTGNTAVFGTRSFHGSGTTQLNNYVVIGNVNYRFPILANVWVEPTTGFQYTRSSFASDAAPLGLADGGLLRLQGGTRVGVESSWNGLRMTTVLTGIVYDNVAVSGGVLVKGADPLILSDHGKLNVEGTLALNFHHGNGVSSFLLVEVQGGEGLFGAGAQMGLRVAW